MDRLNVKKMVTGKTPVYSNRNEVEDGFLILDVFRTSEGHYFELTNSGSSQVNGCLPVSLMNFLTDSIPYAERRVRDLARDRLKG